MPATPVGQSPAHDDTLRSLQLFFGVLLPEPWDVQFQRDDATERPSVLITPAIPTSTGGSAYIRHSTRDFDVFLYPEGVEGKPVPSRIEAETLLETVKRAFDQGIQEDGYQSYSMRLPVYDYTDVDWDQDLPEDAQPFDYLPLTNLTAEARVDPDDDTLFTVVFGVRVQWSSDGDTRRHVGEDLQDVQVGYGGP